MSSWWIENFHGNRDAAQARMRQALPPRAVRSYLHHIAWLDEQENLGRPTERNPVAPVGDHDSRDGQG